MKSLTRHLPFLASACGYARAHESSSHARGLIIIFFWCVKDNNSAFIYVDIASPVKEMYWAAFGGSHSDKTR